MIQPARMMLMLLVSFLIWCVYLNCSVLEAKMYGLLRYHTQEPMWKDAKRGFIIPMFDSMIPIGISLVRQLRRLGNKDLIQVYYCLNELSPISRRLLHRVDPFLEIIDVCHEYVIQKRLAWKEAKQFQNFFIKPLALIHTRLEEVILLDADAILFMDPAKIWQVPAYISNGTMFFYDREINEENFLHLTYVHSVNGVLVEENTLQQIFRLFQFERFGLSQGKPSIRTLESLAYNNQSAHEQDSSMVVVDKRKNHLAMEMLWYLITEWRYRYPTYSWGDKENFWLAYELSQSNYSFSPYGTAAAGELNPFYNETVCGDMAHYFPLENMTKLLYINGNSLINPYTKINFMNGYNRKFESSKHAQLINTIPQYVGSARARTPTVIVQPNDTCPSNCLYQRGMHELSDVQRRAIAHRINDTFEVAAIISSHEKTTRTMLALCLLLSVVSYLVAICAKMCC